MSTAPPEFDPAPRRAPALSAAGVLSLHERLVARDEQALAELIELATPWLLGITQTLLSDPDEAEEVVQEVFSVVWSRVGRIPRDPRGLLAWVFRVARNRAIDRLRSRRRRLWRSARWLAQRVDVEPFVAAREPDEAGTPGWHIHRSIHAALMTLPREQQMVVWLAYFEGLTHSQVAERLAIPIGTVKTRLRLAFDKLRSLLAPLKDWVV